MVALRKNYVLRVPEVRLWIAKSEITVAEDISIHIAWPNLSGLLGTIGYEFEREEFGCRVCAANE